MKFSIVAAAAASSAVLVHAAPVSNNTSPTLPIVDLGYVRQQASSYDVEVGYYNFSNIAFAQPPLGNLRFAAPQHPEKINGVQDGNSGRRVCPQAYPPWLVTLLSQGAVSSIPLDLSNSEDCLYLDVFAPTKVFDQRRTHKAPVIIFIYGGGLVIGSKTTNDPRGLLMRSIQNTNSDGAIYVAANYRVGNFGTLGGSDFVSQGGSPNIALLDQRMALDWVQKNIHQFGGDPDRVTVMGESGGASSIAHQIAGAEALGHGKPLPFQQVILQSPAEAKANSNDQDNKQFHAFLKELNVSTLSEARKLDTAVLQQANYNLVQRFASGTFPYIYNSDGHIVRATARKELLEECAGHDLKAIIAYNLNEGAIFVPRDNTTFDAYVKEWLPTLRSEQFNEVTNELYPASAYPSTSARIDQFIADLLIDCNAAAYHSASDNEAYAYQFGMPTPGSPNSPPGYHIQDLGYSFFDKPDPTVFTDVAIDMQTKFVNFAVHSDPNAAGESSALPVYGSDHKMLQYTAAGVKVITDSEALEVNDRCNFWADF